MDIGALEMTPRQFFGHCSCSYRYGQLLDMIKNKPIEEVLELQKLNEKYIRNPRYQELKQKFNERLQNA